MHAQSLLLLKKNVCRRGHKIILTVSANKKKLERSFGEL